MSTQTAIAHSRDYWWIITALIISSLVAGDGLIRSLTRLTAVAL